jgi:ABC-type sugar transport system substrate-binding protein
MRAGKVQILIGQKYFGWGSESVKLLAAAKGGQVPARTIIDSGVDVVTPANLEQYVAEWTRQEKE